MQVEKYMKNPWLKLAGIAISIWRRTLGRCVCGAEWQAENPGRVGTFRIELTRNMFSSDWTVVKEPFFYIGELGANWGHFSTCEHSVTHMRRQTQVLSRPHG